MQLQLAIKGLSSKKSTFIPVSNEDLNLNLLDFLRMNQITIASSCRGEQICRKCTINKDQQLSCSFTVKEYLEKVGQIIQVDYL